MPSECCGLPRVLLIEPSELRLRRMLGWLGRRCQARPAGRGDPGGAAAACVMTGCSLGDLHDADLDQLELIICATDLPDGSGLDALAYVRGLRPALPLVLAGSPADGELLAEAIRGGAADFMLTEGTPQTVLRLAIEKSLAQQSIRLENERLQKRLSVSLAERELRQQQLKTMIERLEVMARTDELTGLFNRRWLNLTLEGAWAEASRAGLPLAFMMMDVDGLKPVNDRLGHQHGDRLLRLTGRVIEANCRGVDVAARYGGDEFCVLMPHTKLHEAAAVAARILSGFETALQSAEPLLPSVSLSIGIAHNVASHPSSAQQMLLHADEALYAAKATPGNCARVHTAHGILAPAAHSVERT